jgi:hypothetical protein
MVERPSERIEILRDELAEAIASGAEPLRTAELITSLVAASTELGSGSCRLSHEGSVDYPTLRPILDQGGLRFCCTATESHCSGVIDR